MMTRILASVPSRYRWEALLCALLFILSYGVDAYVCANYLPARGVWRKYAATAAMYGLGEGYRAPAPGAALELERFVQGDRRTLVRADLPAEIATVPLDRYQNDWRYLLMSVGLYWRAFGVSWDNLAPLFALFFALATLAVYGLFRIAAGCGLAVAGMLLWIFSPVQLLESSSFRDYSKAPFVLCILLVLAHLVHREQSARRLVAWGAVLGAVMGIGVAYRYDLVMSLPIALLVLLFFVTGDLHRDWRRRLAACAAMLGVFGGFYLLQDQAGSSDQADNIHLGMTAPFSRALGLDGAPYDLGNDYADNEAYASNASYGMRVLHRPSYFRSAWSEEYIGVSRAWLLDACLRFPADRLMQAYAAALRAVDEMPFEEEGVFKPHPSAEAAPIVQLHLWRWTVFGALYGYGHYLLALTLLVLAAQRLRWAIGALLLYLYFAGYTGIQYDVRHAFHTEVFFWWCLIFLLAQAGRFARSRPLPPGGWPAAARRMAALAAVALALVCLPIGAARAWQSATVAELYARYAKAPWVPVKATAQPCSDGNCGGRWQGSVVYPLTELDLAPSCTPANDVYEVKSAYLAIELLGQGAELPVLIHYAPGIDRELLVKTDAGGSTFVYCPVYSIKSKTGWDARITGVVLRAEDQKYLKGIYQLGDPGALTLWPTLVLPADPKKAARYQVLTTKPLPYAGRRANSWRDNLLPQGDFETWPMGANGPAGFHPPAGGAVLAKEATAVAAGKSACRETWTQPDGGTSAIGAQFGALLPDLKSNTIYELHLRAHNEGKAPARVSAFQVSVGGRTPPILERIAPSVLDVPPGAGMGEYAGQFCTGKVEGLAVFLGATYLGKEAPASVVWDDWRLVEVGPGAE